MSNHLPPIPRILHAELQKLPAEERARLESLLTEQAKNSLSYDWPTWARPSQMPPEGDWNIWLLMAGRGFGKTRAGAEWVRWMVEEGHARQIALVGRTLADVRRVMVEGPSGILNISPPWFRPRFEPSLNRITWPNGAIATLYSATTPEQLRGPQHDAAWCDELAAWPTMHAFDMLRFGLRIGEHPRIVITTTPQPLPILKELMDDPLTYLTRGSTFENAALSWHALNEYRRRYENTRLGRQELYAELLDEVDGALFTRDLIENTRIDPLRLPDLEQIIVAIDPAAKKGNRESEQQSETGIVIAGRDASGHGYILADVSLYGSPSEWARRAIGAYEIWEADYILAEANTGGDMVKHTLHTLDARVPIRTVHATRNKLTRATPIAALYEQGKIHHVGYFDRLETQLCTWLPGATSPDRLDAAVWALSELMLTPPPAKLKIQPNPFYS